MKLFNFIWILLIFLPAFPSLLSEHLPKPSLINLISVIEFLHILLRILTCIGYSLWNVCLFISTCGNYADRSLFLAGLGLGSILLALFLWPRLFLASVKELKLSPTLPYCLTHIIFIFSSAIHSLFTHTAAEKLSICQMTPKYSSNSYFHI